MNNNIFNKCIFAYLCIFFIVQQSISMNFKVFLLIFALPIFLSTYHAIFSDISVKSKYRYIRNYRYFVHCLQLTDQLAPFGSLQRLWALLDGHCLVQ